MKRLLIIVGLLFGLATGPVSLRPKPAWESH